MDDKDIIIRIAVKPTPSIFKEQIAMDVSGKKKYKNQRTARPLHLSQTCACCRINGCFGSCGYYASDKCCEN